MRIIATLLLAAMLLTLTAYFRPPEYDEAYSIFLTAGDARPAWPAGIFHPADVRNLYRPGSTPQKIAQDLRTGDVHPPLYFWALEYWRRLMGASWFAARSLSVLFSIAALAALAWIATLAEIPIATTVLITTLSYGFAYTGTVARGFALAQLLNLLGMALTITGSKNRNRGLAFAGGIAFGAAGFTNDLAIFIGLATMSWLVATAAQRKIAIFALVGMASFLPAIMYFFIAQHNSRNGQFANFSPTQALRLLAKDSGAALFGGLPLYAGKAGTAVAAILILLLAICVFFIIRRWQQKLLPFACASAATPLGLLALGFIFNNTPIEIRYLAFSIPFLALLLAQTVPKTWLTILCTVEACGIVGLIVAPATMQPQGLAAHQLNAVLTPSTLVLLPFGNDGVGIPGPFIASAPDNLRLQLLERNHPINLNTEHRIIIATITPDAASRQTIANILAQFGTDRCWVQGASTSLLKVFNRTCAGSQTSH